MRTYKNFDLLIEGEGGKYQARILEAPAGQALKSFRLPFSADKLELLLTRLGAARQLTRRVDAPSIEAAKMLGGGLFDAVFDGAVRGVYQSSLDQCEREGSGLRLRLRLEAPELSELPWEYIYNKSVNRFLALSTGTPLVRFLDLPEVSRPLSVQPPLRALVMISCPTDYPPLAVEQEWLALKASLSELEQRGLIVLERLEDASLIELQRRLRQNQYHIFHFIGHGAFDSVQDDGVLVMEDENERGHPVSGQYLGALLYDHKTLRLAVLNACEGARASQHDPFSGVAQSLLQQRIPAVIAMQFEITDRAALTFSREFYLAIAEGMPVDAALTETRKAIYARTADTQFGTPVLYLRAPEGRIFEMKQVDHTAENAESWLMEKAPATEPDLRLPEVEAPGILEVLGGAQDGTVYTLETGFSTLGRGSGASITFEDASVSRRHAVIELEDGVYRLHDLNSSHGTFVNGVRLSGAYALQDGDQIRLGQTLMRFSLHKAQDQANPQQAEQAPPSQAASLPGNGRPVNAASTRETNTVSTVENAPAAPPGTSGSIRYAFPQPEPQPAGDSAGAGMAGRRGKGVREYSSLVLNPLVARTRGSLGTAARSAGGLGSKVRLPGVGWLEGKSKGGLLGLVIVSLAVMSLGGLFGDSLLGMMLTTASGALLLASGYTLLKRMSGVGCVVALVVLSLLGCGLATLVAAWASGY